MNRKLTPLLLIGLALTIAQCSEPTGQVIPYHKPLKVMFFFIPDCPACKASFPALMGIDHQYSAEEVEIEAIWSDPEPNDSILNKIIDYYKVDVPIVKDHHLELARKHNVTTTPQCLLYDAKGTLLYSGQINNYYYSFGKHRKTITKNYLEDAIKAALEGQEITVKETDPIGCKINYDAL